VITASYLDERRLPLVYTPEAGPTPGVHALCDWITSNRSALDEDLLSHGALLFRGFALHDADAFEQVALALDSGLHARYLGTSPRQRVNRHVLTSTDLPPHYPIMQHGEMSNMPSPPRKLFFFCEVAPRLGGETPLGDLRQVWSDLPDATRQKFEKLGVRYARTHGGPDEASHGFWGTKRWTDMFETNDRGAVELLAHEQGLTLTWHVDGSLTIENQLPAFRIHPQTGTIAWHNHSQVFHAEAAALEYAHIARHQRTLRAYGMKSILKLITSLRRMLPKRALTTHTTFGDGSPISREEMAQVIDALWRNLSIFTWRPADLLVVDNYSVSHGRLPFHGQRKILVALTDAYV
jgi:alpha-ketoglutarate-dependent taurine dioxygenase